MILFLKISSLLPFQRNKFLIPEPSICMWYCSIMLSLVVYIMLFSWYLFWRYHHCFFFGKTSSPSVNLLLTCDTVLSRFLVVYIVFFSRYFFYRYRHCFFFEETSSQYMSVLPACDIVLSYFLKVIFRKSMDHISIPI